MKVDRSKIDREGMLRKMGSYEFHDPKLKILVEGLDDLKRLLVEQDRAERAKARAAAKYNEWEVLDEMNEQSFEFLLQRLNKSLETLPWYKLFSRWKVKSAIRYLKKHRKGAFDLKMELLKHKAASSE